MFDSKCLSPSPALNQPMKPPVPVAAEDVDQPCGSAASERTSIECQDEFSRDTGGDVPPPPRPLPAVIHQVAANIISPGFLPQPSQETKPTPAPPAIDGYEIVEQLGRGGMGVVYRALQREPHRTVALKMVLAGAHASPQELGRFRTEVEAIATLNHPNIVQIYEVGDQDGCAFFSMEFVGGGSLAHRLAGKPQPARDAAQLVETLARAVQFAHEHGIVHRDLKPSNILLQKSEIRNTKSETNSNHPSTKSKTPAAAVSDIRDPDFGFVSDFGFRASDLVPKITDFGLAKRLEAESSQTRTGELMGTPSYMAPEQAEARARDVGPAADTYALGAILYETLTGRPPFLGVTPLETLRQVQSEEPVQPRRLQPKVPRDLETICLKCLEKEPRKRYADAGRLAEDLRRFLVGEPIEARPTPFWERGFKWAKRRPAAAALIAVSTLAALVVAGGGWWSSDRLSSLAADLKSEANRVQVLAETAERQRQVADEQRRIAQANFRQAGEVLDEFIALSEDPRLRSRNLEPLRLEMQQRALDFYARFVEQQSDDPEVRAEQGRAYRRLARITAQSDEKTKAVDLCRKAIDAFEQLSRSHAEQPTYARELALSFCQVAAVYNDMMDRNRAVNAYLKAQPLQEKLVHDFPDDLTYQKELAATYQKLGSTYRDQGGKPRELAEPLLTQSLEMHERLLNNHPDVEAYRQAVASVQLSLGQLYRLTDRLDQADALHRQALETREALLAARPTDLNLQYEIADSHFWLGGLYNAKEQWDHAEAEFRAALVIQQRLFRARPTVTAYAVALGRTKRYVGLALCDRGQAESALEHFDQTIDLFSSATQKEHLRAKSYLVHAHLARAEAYTRLGRHDDAQKDWRQAFTMNKATAWQQTLLRAEQLAKRADYALAAGTADALVNEKPDKSNSVHAKRMFDVAGIYALSASAAGRDEKLPPSDRDKLAADYAARAIEFLQKAYSLGYFKDPAHVEQLKSDSKFESLRSLDAFQKLLGGLAATHE